MRILLLSCNTGEGHNSAAGAIRDYAERHGDVCETVDALSFWSPEVSKIVCDGYQFICRTVPKLFGAGYRFAEQHPPKDGNDSLLYDLMTAAGKDLFAYLEQHPFDAVVCVHVFAAMMMTYLRRQNRFRLPTYFVATDYTCSPGVAENDADGFFIPHADLLDEFAACGVPREKMYVTGIPVREAFSRVGNREVAAKRLHLPSDRPVVLLMCGGSGCGPLHTLAEDLPPMLRQSAHLVVICGKNRSLFRSLTRDPLPENLTVVGYTARMPLYMDAASLIVTKPGGLSSTEAAVKGLPMVFINALPGCETHNLAFFTARGLAEAGDDPLSLARTVCSLVSRPDRLERMSRHLRSSFSVCAVEEIYRLLHRNQ